ncbi:hypothetical protein ACIRTB_22145 [Streptomyces sp. NPDC101158]|uniref:hypothetical protein n=1 Tax=Streptomyces sp. NPDC101158 TaxID=3366117 RepID=UPI0038151346
MVRDRDEVAVHWRPLRTAEVAVHWRPLRTAEVAVHWRPLRTACPALMTGPRFTRLKYRTVNVRRDPGPAAFVRPRRAGGGGSVAAGGGLLGR